MLSDVCGFEWLLPMATSILESSAVDGLFWFCGLRIGISYLSSSSFVSIVSFSVGFYSTGLFYTGFSPELFSAIFSSALVIYGSS